MKEVWPTFWYGDFDFLNFWPRARDGDAFWGSVFGNSLIYYFCWAVPYMIWQLSIGLDLPRTHRKKRHRTTGLPLQPKYDTVYHLNMRDGQCEWMGKLFWGRSKEASVRMAETNEYELRDFFAYMLLHFIGVFASVVLLAWFCSLSKYIHAAWIYGIFLLVILRGANRYVYYGTDMYTSIVRKQFATLLDDNDRASLIGKSKDGDNNDHDHDHDHDYDHEDDWRVKSVRENWDFLDVDIDVDVDVDVDDKNEKNDNRGYGAGSAGGGSASMGDVGVDVDEEKPRIGFTA